jgi:ribokinase
MSRTIVVVGSLNTDLVVRAPRLPQAGETLLGGEFSTFPGGKGANQAVAAARLGGIVTMVGRVGKDDFGEALVQGLAQNGVNTAQVRRDPQAATGVALITVDEAGQNTIVVASDANMHVTADDIHAAEPAIREARVMVLQLEIPLPAVQRAIDLARKHGVTVVLNPAPAQPLEHRLLAGVDYLIPNQGELALLAGLEDIPTAARHLREAGVRNVIVTLGGEGVLGLDEHGEFLLAAHPVQVVDTVAAGDAFVGAFAVALVEGRPAREAARWGNAAGALAVTRAGAQPSLPRRAEVEDFLRAPPG